MDMNRIGGYSAGFKSTSVRTAAVKQEDAADKTKENTQAAKENRDTFEKSTESKPVTYSKNELTKAQADQLLTAQQDRYNSFMKMLQSMVVKQGQKSNLTLFGMDLFVTPEQSADAAASIAEGGEYSVDAVATRIMDMAKALSGGDASKISKLREAVEKGFKAAGVELGGKLPDISQQTHTEVMKRFDEWEKEANGSASVEK